MMRAGLTAAIAIAVLAVGCVRSDKPASEDGSGTVSATSSDEREHAVAASDPGATPAGDTVTQVDGGPHADEPVAAGATPAGDIVPNIASKAAALAAIGKVVQVAGTAEDAKLAGVVVHDDLTVYCFDRRFGWGDKAGSKVTVEGTLEYIDKTAKKRPGGEVSAGTSGPVFVMQSCILR